MKDLHLQFVNFVCPLDCLSVDYSGPHRITEKLFSNTRYFVMKSNNFENVGVAKDRVSTKWGCWVTSSSVHYLELCSQSVWSTPPYNEKKLNKAYRVCDT